MGSFLNAGITSVNFSMDSFQSPAPISSDLTILVLLDLLGLPSLSPEPPRPTCLPLLFQTTHSVVILKATLFPSTSTPLTRTCTLSPILTTAAMEATLSARPFVMALICTNPSNSRPILLQAATHRI